MKKLSKLLNFNSDDELFNYIISTLKIKGITQGIILLNGIKFIIMLSHMK